jgi:UDP-N-acetylglucosamine 2-epimerase (non-hydrolysing)
LAPLGIGPDHAPFILATLHRPSNVDDTGALAALLDRLEAIGGSVPVVFPMHPRTRRNLGDRAFSRVRPVEPLGYLDFLALQARARLVITDSGGVQEETTYLGVPCITVRENTERPITVSMGTNELVGGDLGALERAARAALEGRWKKGKIPPLWDGHAGERIAGILCDAQA